MQDAMQQLPMVSVIIPCYNTERYLSACLESVLAQTYQDFEIIAVNDGSPDQCGEILKTYAEKDARIRVYTQENKGQSSARNVGLNIARGHYILFLDSDDKLPSYAIAKLLEIAQTHQVPVVVSRYYGVSNEEDAHKVFVHRKNIFDSFVNDRKIHSSVWNRLYHRDAIGSLRFKEGIYFEDWPFQTILFSTLSSYATTELSCYIYTNDNESTVRSAFTQKKAMSYLTGIQYVYDYFKTTSQLRLAQKRMAVALKMLINKVSKSKDKQLQAKVTCACSMLLKEGIVLSKDLSIKTRFRLWRMKL